VELRRAGTSVSGNAGGLAEAASFAEGFLWNQTGISHPCERPTPVDGKDSPMLEHNIRALVDAQFACLPGLPITPTDTASRPDFRNSPASDSGPAPETQAATRLH